MTLIPFIAGGAVALCVLTVEIRRACAPGGMWHTIARRYRDGDTMDITVRFRD